MPVVKSKMVDLELDDEDAIDRAIYPTAKGEPVKPDYPWGLCISLTNEELDKLEWDISELKVGESIEFRARADVKSKTESDSESGGPCCRLELQITAIGETE